MADATYCPYCGTVPLRVSEASRATCESWHCPQCSMSWSGSNCQARFIPPNHVTYAAIFATFTQMVKRLRAQQRQDNARFGYPLASMTGQRLEGRIEGFNKVLELVCSNPMED